MARLSKRDRTRLERCVWYLNLDVQKLRELTDGEFRLGFIARLVLRDFWTAGTAPTLRQFADAWRDAQAAHTQPRPEGAYLADLARGEAGADWKELRHRNANEALAILARLVSP